MPRIRVNGTELHYHTQGRATPIVFLHPPCIGSRVFTYLRNDLGRDHRTVAADFRGHGFSAPSAAPLTVPLLAEDVRALLDALDLPSAYLVSYSMGNLVSLEALLAYPQRFRGAALLSGLPEVADPRTRAKTVAAIWALRLKARGWVSFPINWVNADIPETYFRLRDEIRAGDSRNWREYLQAALRYSATDRLSRIRQPMLLMCGERDAVFRNYARMMHERLANSRVAVIPGARHNLPTRAADEVGALIRAWIRAQEGAALDRKGENAGAGPNAGVAMPDEAVREEASPILR
jgi:pimeloyl-ACP methyl ester carboxylesterase